MFSFKFCRKDPRAPFLGLSKSTGIHPIVANYPSNRSWDELKKSILAALKLHETVPYQLSARPESDSRILNTLQLNEDGKRDFETRAEIVAENNWIDQIPSQH